MMVSFADLGIGNGLRTLIAEADGTEDREQLSKLISSATVFLTAVAVCMGLVMLAAVHFLDWTLVFNRISPVLRKEVPGCVLALGSTFLLAVPLQIAQGVQHGLQKGYAATLWSTAGSIVSLAALIIAATLKASLILLILALSGAPLVVTFANFVWFFWRERPDLRPRLAAVEWKVGRRLLRTGGLFMVLQLTGALAFSSDNFVVGAVLGVASVPLLGVPAKLFGIVQQFVNMLNGPLWPAFGEAAARGDVYWVRSTLRRAQFLGISLAIASSVVLIFCGRWFVQHWSRHQVDVSVSLLVALAVWTVFSAWGSTVAMFLNGTGRILVQTFAAIALAPTAFVLKWLLIGPLGLSGVIWATIIAFALCTVGPVWWAQRRTLQQLEERARFMKAVQSGTARY
jgi:O-antigen/teichoic acid export membrane protein